jgi:hypothetical protein
MEKEIKRLLRCFKKTELSEQDVTDAILKLIESSKVVLPQANVIKSVCERCLKEKELKVCNECYCKSGFE